MSDEKPKNVIEIYDNKNVPLGEVDCLHEWRDYVVKSEGARVVSTRGVALNPLPLAGLFLLRFENQLGIANLRAYGLNGELLASRPIEVITDKLGDAVAYHDFVDGLIHDLYQQVVSLPFSLIAPTGYGVEEALLPPTPFFVYHFLRERHKELEAALNTIQAAPYRKLRDYADFVPVAEASEIDADVIITMLQSPKYLMKVEAGHQLGVICTPQEELYGPTHVWQRLSEETYDTAENRFVRHFITELIVAIDELTTQPWWNNELQKLAEKNEWVKDQQQNITDASGLLQDATRHAMFDGVGEMRHFPAASQVLMRRAGYREMRELWQSFSARAPFFDALDQSIELREADKLYEFWVFFKLTEEIEKRLLVTYGDKVKVKIKPDAPEGNGLLNPTKAIFRCGKKLLGTLYYNRGRTLNYTLRGPEPAHSLTPYSLEPRPDYLYERYDKEGKPLKVGFDAKFRIDEKGQPKQDDLVKMHAYCQMLKLKAAIILYPGEDTCYRTDKQASCDDLIAAALDGSYTDVGAIGLRPD